MQRLLVTQRARVIAAVAAIVVIIVAVIAVAATRDAGQTVAPAPIRSTNASASPSSAPAKATATAKAASSCATPSSGPPSGNVAANFPTALAFAPDGRLFIAERDGRIVVASGSRVTTFATVPTVTTEPDGSYSERGLLGIALSPTFASDHLVYAFYSLANWSGQRVVRFTECAGRGTAERTIVNLPSGNDCCHKGGRLAFGPDGKLYVSLGDEHTSTAAQSLSDVRGKILRYNPDGSIPADNPYHNAVWVAGLRNPFGIAFGNIGQLFVTSNGPSGDSGSPSTGYDTATIVTRGEVLQWADCYGYSHPMPGHSSCGGHPAPMWSSENSTVIPTGATWVDASGPAAYRNHFVFCTYGAGMKIFTPGSPHATVASGPAQCQTAVVEGPNHAVYYADTTRVYKAS